MGREEEVWYQGEEAQVRLQTFDARLSTTCMQMITKMVGGVHMRLSSPLIPFMAAASKLILASLDGVLNGHSRSTEVAAE